MVRTSEFSGKHSALDAITAGLTVYLQPGQVSELRVLGVAGGDEPFSRRYDYDHLADMARKAFALDQGGAKGCYITPNRLNKKTRAAATDAAVAFRDWLLLDLDPIRPADLSATTVERVAARCVARSVAECLADAGLGGEVVVDSSNGFHLDCPILLPNDEPSTQLVQAILQGLQQRHGTDRAKVDTRVYNASRIWKLPGTVSRKGEPTPERPHRRSRLLSGTPATVELRLGNTAKLRELAARWAREDSSRIFVMHEAKDRRTAYGEGALANELTELAGKKRDSQQRNNQLNDAAFALGQLVGGGVLDEGLVQEELQWVAEDIGLTEGEIPKTIRSGLEAGKKQPRGLPDDDDAEDAGQEQAAGDGPEQAEDAAPADGEPAESPPPAGGDAQAKPGKKKKDKGGGTRGSSASTVLVGLAHRAGVELFHAADEAAYATVPVGARRETYPLRSTGFRRLLNHLFYVAAKKTAGSQAVQDAIATLEGQAVFEGPEHPVQVRLAEREGRVYLDLADREWRVVEIGPEGWRVLPAGPVKFRRPKCLWPLPVPVPGGSVEELGEYVNIRATEDFQLLVAWLVGALRPAGPYPILFLLGEQGACKSTTARALRRLIDPHKALIRSEPREGRDLMIAASNSWVAAFDNLSRLPNWLSDALCRLSTGGGFTTRELYSNDEETVFDAMRPCLVSSIEDLAGRGDLLERAILLRLPSISDQSRRTEREYFAALDEARPRILGALLTAVAGALADLESVRLPTLPRMADFAAWVTAAEGALEWPAGSFLDAYRSSQREANEVALESSPLVGPVRKLLETTDRYDGPAADLLQRLNQLAGDDCTKSKDWPKRPNVLANRLRRVAPNLRRSGIDVEFSRSQDSDRKRLITLIHQEKVRKRSSGSSGSSGSTSDGGATREAFGTSADHPVSGNGEGDRPETVQRSSGDRPEDAPDDAPDDPRTISPKTGGGHKFRMGG
jgi:hypothetical protein